MNIETLGAKAAAISLSAEELESCADTAQLHALIRNAQAARGLPLWESMDAKLFVCGEKILLLAWPTQAFLFSFSDFESLLNAAFFCSAETDSALTYLDGSWLLRLSGAPGKTPAALQEYGAVLPEAEALSAHAAEHGEVIFAFDAVAQLQAHFPV